MSLWFFNLYLKWNLSSFFQLRCLLFPPIVSIAEEKIDLTRQSSPGFRCGSEMESHNYTLQNPSRSVHCFFVIPVKHGTQLVILLFLLSQPNNPLNTSNAKKIWTWVTLISIFRFLDGEMKNIMRERKVIVFHLFFSFMSLLSWGMLKGLSQIVKF